MMTADVSDSDIIILTSLCWDEDTRKCIANKLSNEMKSGAVVVDYRADTFSDFGLDSSTYAYGGGEDNCSSSDSDGDDVDDEDRTIDDGDEEDVMEEDDAGTKLLALVIDDDMKALDRALSVYTQRDAPIHSSFYQTVFSSGGHSHGNINKYPSKYISEIIGGSSSSTSSEQGSAKVRYSKAELLGMKRKQYTKDELLALKNISYVEKKVNNSATVISTKNKTTTKKSQNSKPGLFELRSIIEGPCSWSSNQQLYIHVKD